VRRREQSESARTLDHADGLCVDSDAMMAGIAFAEDRLRAQRSRAALVVVADGQRPMRASLNRTPRLGCAVHVLYLSTTARHPVTPAV
jgi:hypothetical protein